MRLSKISKSFLGKVVLDDININFENLGLYAIIGESGSGKTTLLNIITKYITDYEGDVYFGENNIKDIDYEDMVYYISNVSQDNELHKNLTVYENLQIIPFKVEENIEKVLELLDISALYDKKVYKLSDEEMQRLTIARALLLNSPIIVFDEPTSNMDSQNYKFFMDFINVLKNKKLILILTHDDRVIKDGDIAYKLENSKLNLLKSSENLQEKIIENKKKKKEYKNINRLFFKRNFKSSLSIYIAYFFIMSIFILSFFTLNSIQKNIENDWLGTIDNTSIHMNINQMKDLYFDGKIYWSDDDINNLKEIEHVTDVVPFEGSVIYPINKNVDTNKYSLDEKFTYNNQEIELSFNTLSVPKEIYQNYGNKTPKIIAGDYPNNNSDELLIPDIFAYTRSEDIQSLVGTEIEFNVIDTKSEKNNKKNVKYKIVGIYEYDIEELSGGFPMYIYTGDRQSTYNPYSPDKEGYESFLDTETILPGVKAEFKGTAVEDIDITYDDYIKGVGIGLPDILVKVDSPENVKVVQEDIKSILPDYILESRYEYKHGILKERTRGVKNIIIIYYVVSILVFMIMNYLIFKKYIFNRMREFNINYMLGYSKKKLVSVLEFELIVKNLILFFIFIILGLVIQYKVDSYLTNNMINLSSLIMVFIFIILTNLINILTIYKLSKNDKLRNEKIHIDDIDNKK